MKLRKKHIIGFVLLSGALFCAFSQCYGEVRLPEGETISSTQHQKSFTRTRALIFSWFFSQDNEGPKRVHANIREKRVAAGTNGLSAQKHGHSLNCSKANLSSFNSSMQGIYSINLNPRQNGFLGIFSGFSPPLA